MAVPHSLRLICLEHLWVISCHWSPMPISDHSTPYLDARFWVPHLQFRCSPFRYVLCGTFHSFVDLPHFVLRAFAFPHIWYIHICYHICSMMIHLDLLLFILSFHSPRPSFIHFWFGEFHSICCYIPIWYIVINSIHFLSFTLSHLILGIYSVVLTWRRPGHWSLFWAVVICHSLWQ